MDRFEKKTIKTGRGFTYTYYVTPANASNTDKPALLFHHGWPDSHKLWIKLLPTLEQLPNRIVLPDLLGYGGTDKPTETSALAFSGIAQDMIDILDQEKIPKVISIGHDHGSIPSQRLYNFFPDRVAAMILFNVAYSPGRTDPNAPGFDLEKMNAFTKKTFGYPLYEYWNFFALDPDAPRLMRENADRVWEGCHTDNHMMDMFCTPGAWRKFVTDRSVPAYPLKKYGYDEELKKEWVEDMKVNGFESPLLWYNSIVDGTQGRSDLGVKAENWVVRVPVLFVGCTQDHVCRADFIEGPKKEGLLPDLTVVIEESGHWCQLEIPEKVAGDIVKFVKEKGL